MMKKRCGFTLIELLVVIAIIAMLMAIIMPALKAAKKQATGIICMSHLGGLSRAWLIYSQDNNNKLCGGNTYTNDEWIGPPVDDNGNQQTALGYEATLEEEIRGYRAGQLYPYFETEKIFHCPGDSGTDARYRSYRSVSITGLMNGEQGGSNDCVKQMDEIVSPGNKFVFIENIDPRGWNGGSWIMGNFDYANGPNPDWTDPVAIFHIDRSTFGFADGHAEKRTWVDKSTIEMSRLAKEGDQSCFNYPINWGAGEGEDIIWTVRGYVPGK